MAHEINLVPDVKQEMIKAQKMRNFILFVCIIVSAAAIGIVVILAGIVGGQNIRLGGQDSRLDAMSAKINSYEELSELLTIQGQLSKLSEISNNKTVLSRVFNFLDVLLPTGLDTITISELNVNLENSTLSFDGQADAGTSPYIDYRVLETFKKSMSLMRYDYGRYVDEYGSEIPTACIRETDAKGNILMKDKKYYAIWTRGVAGCNPSEEGDIYIDLDEDEENEEGESEKRSNSSTTDEVMIWRTPDFQNWYEGSDRKITLDGQITGVPHFVSSCIKYTGTEYDGSVKWTSVNSCKLVPEEIAITDSSNGRESGGNLVLRFSTIIKIEPEAFAFANKHMMAIAPTGHINMTDSYIQIKSMFEERASDCLDGDDLCTSVTYDTNTTTEDF